MDNVQKGDSCSFSHDRLVPDETYDRLLLHQIRRPRLTKSEKNPQKHQATDRKALQTKKERNSMPIKNCLNPSCTCWHHPVCQNYKSKTGCTYGRKCFFRHVEADEKPSKSL